MTQLMREAYAEIDNILDILDKDYVEKIPYKLRHFFKSKRSRAYNKKIVRNKPLKEQNLRRETLAILAILNHNYWCKDDEKRKKLMKKYKQNG